MWRVDMRVPVGEERAGGIGRLGLAYMRYYVYDRGLVGAHNRALGAPLSTLVLAWRSGMGQGGREAQEGGAMCMHRRFTSLLPETNTAL